MKVVNLAAGLGKDAKHDQILSHGGRSAPHRALAYRTLAGEIYFLPGESLAMQSTTSERTYGSPDVWVANDGGEPIIGRLCSIPYGVAILLQRSSRRRFLQGSPKEQAAVFTVMALSSARAA